MATQLSIPRTLFGQATSLQERIDGTKLSRVVAEFVSTSALFPILDSIRVITAEGWIKLLSEPSHYVLFGAAFVQAWFLGTAKSNSWQVKFVGNLLGFALYVPIDLAIEGVGFFYEPYHWLFGGFSLLMATLSALQSLARHRAVIWQTIVTLMLNISKTALLPAMYFITEQNLNTFTQLTWFAWQNYIGSSGHQFLMYGTLFFGALLGLAEAQRINYADFLHYLAQQLKQYSEWSLGSDLIADAIDNPNALELRRVEKTMLFMDIRGFTAWSENTNPRHVVNMLNRYYNAAEEIIGKNGGHKPNFTADEVMTRFTSPQIAINTALELQRVLSPILATFSLAVGVGVHTGDVIEGLMGSDSTRKFDIIGDAVNTAKRLESAAGHGEIVMSVETYQVLTQKLTGIVSRKLQVKGKSKEIQVVAVLAKS